MKNLTGTILVLVTLSLSLVAYAGEKSPYYSEEIQQQVQLREDPPFPWQLCEIDLNKVYGHWVALEFDGSLLFGFTIEQKATFDGEQTVISMSQYNPEGVRTGRGIGIVMHDRKSLLGAMRTQSDEARDYWVYVKTFCEEVTGRQRTYVEMINIDGEGDSMLFLLEKSRRPHGDSAL